MSISITHKFTCTVPDDPDTDLVRPSDWNDTHAITGIGSAAEADAADFAPAVHGHDFADIASVPAFLTSETDPVFSASPAAGITGPQISNWDAAFTWGNHATAGYLTSFAETDPVFYASAAASITTTNISNWNSAFGWGDHSASGYLTSSHLSGDQHAQYALLAGRAAGQTIAGGTGSGDNLTLTSTTHSTKGAIVVPIAAQRTNPLIVGSSAFSDYISGWGGIWFGTTSLLSGNFGFAGNGSRSLINAASSVEFMLAGITALTLKNSKLGLGIDTATPDYIVTINGNAAETVGQRRHTTANTAGNNLTVQAGGATVGATNKAGGTLVLKSGIATGTGESGVQIQTAKSGASGTADRTPTTIIEALGDKLAFNGATPVTKPTVTGSRGGNAALASLLTALAQLGLITDSTTA